MNRRFTRGMNNGDGNQDGQGPQPEPGAPDTPSKLEQQLTARIVMLEGMITGGNTNDIVKTPPTHSPFSDSLIAGGVGSLSAQKTDNGKHPIAYGLGGTLLALQGGRHTPGGIDVELLACSNTLRAQIQELDQIFKEEDLCLAREQKLGLKESRLMFEASTDTGITDGIVISGDNTPAPLPRPSSSNPEPSQPEVDANDNVIVMTTQDELDAVQKMLESITKYKSTLRRRLKAFIQSNFGLRCTTKEEVSQHKTHVKFVIPPGVGNDPNIRNAKLFKVSLEQHITAFPVTNVALLPILNEILGKNNKIRDRGGGEMVSQKRWSPPNLADPQYLIDSPYKSFNARFNAANKDLYLLMSHQQIAKVKSYHGIRSNGAHGLNKVITDGKENDACSIITSIIFYHESVGYSDLLLLKQQCVNAYTLFGTRPIAQAVKAMRTILDKAVTVDLKVPWVVISKIVSVLIQRSPIFAAYMTQWMEPHPDTDPDDCLQHVLLFTANVEHVGAKIKMSIMDHQEKTPMNVYQTDTRMFDINNTYGNKTKNTSFKNRNNTQKQDSYKRPGNQRGRGTPNTRPPYDKGRGRGTRARDSNPKRYDNKNKPYGQNAGKTRHTGPDTRQKPWYQKEAQGKKYPPRYNGGKLREQSKAMHVHEEQAGQQSGITTGSLQIMMQNAFKNVLTEKSQDTWEAVGTRKSPNAGIQMDYAKKFMGLSEPSNAYMVREYNTRQSKLNKKHKDAKYEEQAGGRQSCSNTRNSEKSRSKIRHAARDCKQAAQHGQAQPERGRMGHQNIQQLHAQHEQLLNASSRLTERAAWARGCTTSRTPERRDTPLLHSPLSQQSDYGRSPTPGPANGHEIIRNNNHGNDCNDKSDGGIVSDNGIVNKTEMACDSDHNAIMASDHGHNAIPSAGKVQGRHDNAMAKAPAHRMSLHGQAPEDRAHKIQNSCLKKAAQSGRKMGGVTPIAGSEAVETQVDCHLADEQRNSDGQCNIVTGNKIPEQGKSYIVTPADKNTKRRADSARAEQQTHREAETNLFCAESLDAVPNEAAAAARPTAATDADKNAQINICGVTAAHILANGRMRRTQETHLRADAAAPGSRQSARVPSGRGGAFCPAERRDEQRSRAQGVVVNTPLNARSSGEARFKPGYRTSKNSNEPGAMHKRSSRNEKSQKREIQKSRKSGFRLNQHIAKNKMFQTSDSGTHPLGGEKSGQAVQGKSPDRKQASVPEEKLQKISEKFESAISKCSAPEPMVENSAVKVTAGPSQDPAKSNSSSTNSTKSNSDAGEKWKIAVKGKEHILKNKPNITNMGQETCPIPAYPAEKEESAAKQVNMTYSLDEHKAGETNICMMVTIQSDQKSTKVLDESKTTVDMYKNYTIIGETFNANTVRPYTRFRATRTGKYKKAQHVPRPRAKPIPSTHRGKPCGTNGSRQVIIEKVITVDEWLKRGDKTWNVVVPHKIINPRCKSTSKQNPDKYVTVQQTVDWDEWENRAMSKHAKSNESCIPWYHIGPLGKPVQCYNPQCHEPLIGAAFVKQPSQCHQRKNERRPSRQERRRLRHLSKQYKSKSESMRASGPLHVKELPTRGSSCAPKSRAYHRERDTWKTQSPCQHQKGSTIMTPIEDPIEYKTHRKEEEKFDHSGTNELFNLDGLVEAIKGLQLNEQKDQLMAQGRVRETGRDHQVESIPDGINAISEFGLRAHGLSPMTTKVQTHENKKKPIMENISSAWVGEVDLANRHSLTCELGLPSNHPLIDFCSKATANFQIIPVMVDTGCASTLIKTKYTGLVQNKVQSPAVVSGFQGSERVRGGVRGTAHFYALDVEGLGSQDGGYIRHRVDTLESLNENLLSLSSIYGRDNYNMTLPSKRSGKTCGIHKEDSFGNITETLPMFWDPKKGAFMMYLVMATSKSAAKDWGERAQSYMKRAKHKPWCKVWKDEQDHMKRKHASECNEFVSMFKVQNTDSQERRCSMNAQNPHKPGIKVRPNSANFHAENARGGRHVPRVRFAPPTRPMSVNVKMTAYGTDGEDMVQSKPIIHHQTRHQMDGMPSTSSKCHCKFKQQFKPAAKMHDSDMHPGLDKWDDQTWQVFEDSTRKDALHKHLHYGGTKQSIYSTFESSPTPNPEPEPVSDRVEVVTRRRNTSPIQALVEPLQYGHTPQDVTVTTSVKDGVKITTYAYDGKNDERIVNIHAMMVNTNTESDDDEIYSEEAEEETSNNEDSSDYHDAGLFHRAEPESEHHGQQNEDYDTIDIGAFKELDYARNDSILKGMKSGMGKSRLRNLTEYELHKRRGHLGYYPNCFICRMIRGSHRKIATKHAPFIETRTGYSFVGDTITWSHASRHGNKYTIVLRDIASGFFVTLPIRARSESTATIRDWVTTARKNPLFSQLGYPIMRSLRLDPAGEWNYKNQEFMNMIKDVGITIMWSSPDDKRSNAHAENSCKQIEVVAKSILLENNLPFIFIEDAVRQGTMLRNLFPLSRNINSSDGDAIRPLEEITCGQISRRQCDNRIHHMVTIGSPCIVHSPKVKGSRIDRTKSRWGVAMGLCGDVPIFIDPYDKGLGRTFTSKNYHEITMPDGYNFYQLLGLKEPELIRDANGNPIFPRPHKLNTKLRTVVEIGRHLGKGVETATASTGEVLDRTETQSEYHDPTITLIDEHGNIYDQFDGRLRPTGDTIHGVTKKEKPESKELKRKRQLIENINHHPRSLIGMAIYKFYEGHGLCKGKIAAYKKNDKFWKVVYESDGTNEEFDREDMVTYLVEEKDVHLHSIGAHRDPVNLPEQLSQADLDDSMSTQHQKLPPTPANTPVKDRSKLTRTTKAGTSSKYHVRKGDTPDPRENSQEEIGFYKGELLPPWRTWTKKKKVSQILNKMKCHGITVPRGFNLSNGKLRKLWGKCVHLDSYFWEHEIDDLYDISSDEDISNSDTNESEEQQENSMHVTAKEEGKVRGTLKPTHPTQFEMGDLGEKGHTPNEISLRLKCGRGVTFPIGKKSPLTHTKDSTNDAVCALKTCDSECYIEENGKVHKYCCRTHAKEDGAIGRSPKTPPIDLTKRSPPVTSPTHTIVTQSDTSSDDEGVLFGTTQYATEYVKNSIGETTGRRSKIKTSTPLNQIQRTIDLTQEGVAQKGQEGVANMSKELSMPTYLRDVEQLAYITTPKESRMNFLELCELIDLQRADDRFTYYHWLGPTYGEEGIDVSPWAYLDNPTNFPIYGAKFSNPWGVKETPSKRRELLIKGGTSIPRPQGAEWKRLTLINDERDKVHADNSASAKAMKCVMQEMQNMNAMMTKMGRIVTELPDQIDLQQQIMIENKIHEIECRAYRTATAPNETRQDIIRRFFQSSEKPDTITGGIIHPLTGKIMAPQDFQKIFTREDREKWMEATLKELDAFDKRDAILHDLTLTEIREMGITHSPVPMRLIFDVKYFPDGTLQKFKARQVVQGHKKYMRFGEHFHTTFAPAPTLATNRLLQAVITHKKLHRVVFDICTAYLWAPAPKHERIPLRYPIGLRRYHPETGEELMGVLLKMIYGCPQSAFRWAEHRQKWMERHFKNTLKWGYHQARQDPCLTVLTSPQGVVSYVVSHVDDIELAGSDLRVLKYIEDQYRQEFEITPGNPRFMLGIQRDMEKLPNKMASINLTQPDFLEETYALYQDKMKNQIPGTPMPVGEFLYLGQDASSDSEHKYYLGLGFQNIAGACLWGARNCFPECMYGTAQVCRLMSKPNKRAWECACRILQYMYHKRKTGIRFRQDGCPYLQCYYDSSHKADPTDGKAQYGWVITLMNGPIEWNSKKHNHVGISSSHNEYMALSHATKAVMWMRQLLMEMGLQEYIPAPTPMLGDNDQATLLSQQDMVTNGNKFYLLDYHYGKEQVKEGHTSTRRVDTKSNYSDMFTKAVPKADLDRLGEVVKGNQGLHQDTPPKSPE